MKLIIDEKAIVNNIEKAKALVTTSAISVMLKSFYEYLEKVVPEGTTLFSKTIKGSVCYSINEANENHSAAVVICIDDVMRLYQLGVKTFYIPINALDDREGLSVSDALFLAKIINALDGVSCIAMLTSGCINEKSLTLTALTELWNKKLKGVMTGISLGGSFYLQKRVPKFVTEVRIGEYMLFGTIPYCSNVSLFGTNALSVEMEVVGVYRERKQIIVKGGYEHIDTKDSKLLSGGIEYVDSSCDYTIYSDPFDKYSVGDKVLVVPSYKSLVKLRYVEREYKE